MANEFVARKGLIVSGSTHITGSFSAVGTVTASAFKGDGSELYNLPSSSLTLIIEKEFFVGDGLNNTFSLAHPYHTSSILVSVDGLAFTNDVDYTLTGNALEFAVTPPSQSNILVTIFVNSFNGGVGSYTGSFLGNFESASYALTASYAINGLTISGSDTEGNTYNKAFTKLQFDSDTGLHVSESSLGTAFVSIASHFRDIVVSGSGILRATGSDAVEIIASGGLEVSISNIDTNGDGYTKELRFSATPLSESLNTRATTGSNNFVGNQVITGSLTISGSSTLINIGPTIFSGSLSVTEGITGSVQGTSSWASSTVTASYVLPSGLPSILAGAYATTGSNRFVGNQIITGSLSISNDLIVLGSSSIRFISSALNIGANRILLNAQGSSSRFGGISVVDSGSARFSGSLFFDSLNNRWLFEQTSGSIPPSYKSAILIAGPRNTTGSLGDESTLITRRIPVATSDHNIGNSQISDDGNNVHISGGLYVSGTINGTFAGTISNATLAQTASLALTASYVAGAETNWGALSGKPEGLVSSSTQVDFNAIQNPPTTVETASYVEFMFVGNKPSLVSSSQQINTGSFQGTFIGLASSASYAEYINPDGLPEGTVSSSGQAIRWSVETSSWAEVAKVALTSSVDWLNVNNKPVGLISSSLQFTSSNAPFTGSFFGTASYVISASYAAVISGNIATANTASYVFPSGLPDGTISSSNQVDLSNTFNTASHAISSSYASFTSLAQTASFATITPLAVTASYALVTAGYISNADTASYAVQAVTASHATFAEYASTSSRLFGGPNINDASLSGSYIPLWQNSTQQTTSNIFLRNNKVNIGDDRPSASLHVSRDVLSDLYRSHDVGNATLLLDAISNNFIIFRTNEENATYAGLQFHDQTFNSFITYRNNIFGADGQSYATNSFNSDTLIYGAPRDHVFQVGSGGVNAKTEVLRIKQNGNVSIGSIAIPQTKLHVDGVVSASSFRGDIFFGQATNAATASQAITASYALNSAGFIENAATASYVYPTALFGAASSSDQVKILLPEGTVSSSEQIATGSFWGGINSASYAITASYAEMISGTYAMAITSSYALTSSHVDGGATNYIPLWRNRTQMSASWMIQANENIGIRTTNPLARLHVVKSVPQNVGTIPTSSTLVLDGVNDNFLWFRNSRDNNSYAGLVFQDNNLGGYILYRNGITGSSDPDNAVISGSDSMQYGAYFDHVFQNGIQQQLGSRTETMRITVSGSVGIGVQRPTAKLHVDGDVSASSFKGTYTGSFSGSYFGTMAGTASWADNATNAINATTASYVLPLNQNVNISGSLTVLGLLTAVSMSTQYVTSSQLNISDNKITVQTNDLVRFGGLSIYDSGSTAATASIYWDSQNHNFIYENLSGSGYNSAIFIAGPQNTGPLGNEVGLTAGRVPVAVGSDHIDSRVQSSSIRIDFPSRLTHIEAGLIVTGAITTSVAFSGPLTGSVLGTASNATTASFALSSTGITGGTANYIPLWTSATVQSSSNIFQSASNVGIGTTNPLSRLQVGVETTVGGNAPKIGINSDTVTATATENTFILINRTGRAGSLIGLDSSGAGETLTNNIFTIATEAGRGGIDLRTSGSYTSGLQTGLSRIRILDGGNVGINTTNPSYGLEVSGTVNFRTSNVKLIGGNFYNENIRMSTGSTGYSGLILGASAGDSGTANGQWSIFRVSDPLGKYFTINHNGTDTFTITTGSNVGIGNTNPGAKLHVQGNISASSYTSSIANAVGFLGTGSWAVTASYALNAAGGGGAGASFPYTGSAIISGSLLITGSSTGSTVFRVAGAAGDLFSVDDSLTGTLFAVTKADNNPIIEALSDGTVIFGTGSGDIFYTSSYVGIGRIPTITAGSPKLQISSSMNVTGSLNVLGNISGAITLPSGLVSSSLQINTGSFSGSITTASFALTASYALNAGAGGSGGTSFPFTGSAIVSGTLLVTGSTNVLGSFSATTKSFKIDHRLLSGKSLIYGVLEGPEHAVYVRGRLKGNNTITLPEEWSWLIDNNTLTVQLTPIGNHQTLYVKEIIDGIIFVNGDDDIDCFYFVQATRKDVEPLQTVV